MALSKKNLEIALAVDTVIFTVLRGELNVLLIQMKKRPYEARWAFPGGRIDANETTEEAARRILQTQTGVADVFLEQLATFDDPERDALSRVVSVVYYALIPAHDVRLVTTERYADVRWWPVRKLSSLAYDHDRVAQIAVRRLRAKLEYTNIAWSVLTPEFTLTELQQVYETILDRKLDKWNFRKKIQALNLLSTSGKKRKGESHRPAQLYRFKKREPATIDLF